jgi:aryl carrier-like protein
MDNRATRKEQGAKELIAEAGASVLCCITVYSPDLNPIEASGNRVRRFVRSKVKAYLGEARARIRGDLLTANADGLQTIRADSCVGWWRHAGYAVDFKRK